MDAPDLDCVGIWTEVKLAILREYASAYATVLAKQDIIEHYAYIDGFAGAGCHVSERTGQLIDGSPRIALEVRPPFSHYHFIDLSGQRVNQLMALARCRNDVTVYQGDCSQILLEEVFPKCRFEDYRRAICLLDPYTTCTLHRIMPAAIRSRETSSGNTKPEDCSMGTRSTIEWTESTWNPVTGCTKISPGCQHCYAERMARRLQAMGQPNYVDGFRLTMHEHAISLPLKWKSPQMVFVNSMSDLFHARLPFEFIRRVFDTMNRAEWHTFQVLTKRADRLQDLSCRLTWTNNIWMGVSVESDGYSSRIGQLRQTEARVKFLSLEPLLSALPHLDLTGIDWVIVGGESGPGARPMDERWVLDIRDQCVAAGVPFFFKQWGGVNKKKNGRVLHGRTWDELPTAAATPVS
jgi:protein gp37